VLSSGRPLPQHLEVPEVVTRLRETDAHVWRLKMSGWRPEGVSSSSAGYVPDLPSGFGIMGSGHRVVLYTDTDILLKCAALQ
jgi:hypothetical protein